MSSENSFIPPFQVPLPLPCNASPAVFKMNDRSIKFLPRLLPGNEFSTLQALHSQSHQILDTECSAIQGSSVINRNFPGRESAIVQGQLHLTNQLNVNESHKAENSQSSQHQPISDSVNVNKCFPSSTDRLPVSTSNTTPYFQRNQLSSERLQMIQDFHQITDQLPVNGPNIPQLSYPPIHQLASYGMNQALKMFNQQPSTSTSCVPQIKCFPTHVLPQYEFERNQINYPLAHQQSEGNSIMRQGLNPPAHQQSERESIMRLGLQSIFESHSGNRLGMAQNPYMPGHQSGVNLSLHPLPTTFLEMGHNVNQTLSDSDLSLCPKSGPRYTEEVHICVVGPPGCGKTDLIRTFARNDAIQIQTGKPLSRVFQQGMVSFETTLKIDIWYGEDPTSSVMDLRSLCQTSKCVIVLVYSVARKHTLFDAIEWIKSLKSDAGFNAPIILVGNSTDVDSLRISSREFPELEPNLSRFSDGVQAKEKYDLAEFYECSIKCVNDVDAVFLIAALKLFIGRYKQKLGDGKFKTSSGVF